MDRKKRALGPQTLTEEEDDGQVERLAEESDDEEEVEADLGVEGKTELSAWAKTRASYPPLTEEEKKRITDVLQVVKAGHHHEAWLAGQPDVHASTISMWKKGIVSGRLKERINRVADDLLAEAARLRAAEASGSVQPRHDKRQRSK